MFKVACWNVNSISSRLSRAQEFLKRHSPDILCLQELKGLDEKFPFDTFRELGYHAEVFGQKTYNGVAILSKEKPLFVMRGFGDGVEDPQSRFIWAKYAKMSVGSVYAPNGQAVGAVAYAYKLEWFRRLRKFLETNAKVTESFILAGDFNVAPEDRDVHDPAAWRGSILCSEPERKSLAGVCEFGLKDTFRKLHSESGLFSWWDYRALAFPFNKGLRIDLILASTVLWESCVAASIDRDERKGEKPSDHAPCLAEFSV